MLFTDDDFLNPVIPQTLQKVADRAHGKELEAVLSEVSQHLTVAMMGADTGELAFEETPDPDGFDFDFEGDSDNEPFGLDVPQTSSAGLDEMNGNSSPADPDADMKKIRADLHAIKNSGFRVGVYGNLTSSGILSVSIRVAKLGLSDEAMQAWNLHRKHYLVLLIKYARGYKAADALDLESSVEMRVGLCGHYKPTIRHVYSAFQSSRQQDVPVAEDEMTGLTDTDHPLEPLFIGKALNELLAERLFKIIHAREQYKLSWLGAEMLMDRRQGFAPSAPVALDIKQYHCDDDKGAKCLPAIARADHMHQLSLPMTSLPLIIMQFVLRHFVRCTEFCLVCHCRMDESLEALKPYVCSKPLCLYQYMSLGFGPSLEWEIMSQPYVVDLLVSFCYAAARSSKLKEMPVGLGLNVPVLPSAQTPAGPPVRPAQGSPASLEKVEASFGCKWDWRMQYLILEDASAVVKGLKCGVWLVLICRQTGIAAHCRVTKVDIPRISLGEQIYVRGSGRLIPQDTASSDLSNTSGPSISPADGYLYDKSFDELLKDQQQNAVVALLDTLPGVEMMCSYLKDQGNGPERSLRGWVERISEASLNLLRWIVASNRSCIVLGGEVRDDTKSKSLGPIAEDSVGGMDSWMQFRFAQGAPDKEKRFNDCVKAEAEVTKSAYPTLFAFHGSRLANWHSIVRQGLRFDEVTNGRAYGNGVYMSPYAETSLAYSERGADYDANSPHRWPRSMLKIMKVFSLNEVVNHPQKFVSNLPHYVVSNIDWVQTRYLFVKGGQANPANTGLAGAVYEQDPNRVARNEQREPISIPISAISKCRRPGNAVQTTPTPGGKRSKSIFGTDQATMERQADDGDSIVSDEDDLALIQGVVEKFDIRQDGLRDPSSQTESLHGVKRPANVAEDTDFVPGTLDTSGITFMEEPRGAASASSSTKALMRSLKDALAVQDKTSPATLGWYIDRNLISNMYQWIVELHSFPHHLPLAQDMKAASVSSIVLEMRFTNQFPFSPPFIRVVKPRFLPFARGGGGNVTEGGAMCMEVLTNTGWSAGLTVENLLLQVRLAIADEERPARLATHSFLKAPKTTYDIGEAKAAYVRACKAHGWTVPADFNTF